MKVVVIAKSFSKGGAATGAFNLTAALRAMKIDVLEFDGYESNAGSSTGFIRKSERVLERVLFGKDMHCLRFGRPTYGLQEIVEKYEPDIIQLCDVSGNVISFNEISRIDIPIVHRLSDFWPYGGPSHYMDLSRSRNYPFADLLMKRLFKIETDVPQALVCPSKWLALKIRDFANGANIKFIPNAQDLNQTEGRTRVLKDGRITFGFIAHNVLDSRKGFLNLQRFISKLSERIEFITIEVYGFCSNKESWPSLPRVNVNFNGAFKKESITAVYNSFDILLCPSQYDNSPNVVTEALSFGCPVIAQIGTGIESYLNTNNGLLIDFYSSDLASVDQFCNGCEEMISKYELFSFQALTYVQENLSHKIVGEKYYSLYQSLLAHNL